LRPVKGGELDIIDTTSGEPVFTIARRSPAAGADVRTTISAQLQQAAVTQIRKESKAGSAVALDPASGEVLVLASSPMYNPNDFSIGFSDNESVRFNALLPQSPYLDRAVAGQYPIGSLMKVTSLAAALENGIGADHVFDCTGSFLIPGQAHPSIDDSPHGHGDITEVTGLAESCDVVFWTIGVTLNSQNPNLLPNMAKTFGYGSLTHIVGLPDGTEQPGLVPDAAWLKQFNGGDWAPVDAANLAIGQGFFTATPLQIAVVSGAVANGGTRWQPRLVTSIVGPDGAAIATYAATALGKLAVSSDHLAVMQAAMVDVTTMPGATSYGTWNGFPALVAAKTGTAQTSTPIPDALYMCYSPASPLSGPPVKAKVAASAVVEYSGFGDAFAQPVTRAILTAYLAPSGS
jgi:penicillin-binding protein 2